MHRGNIGQFFKIRVFNGTQAGFGVDGSHNTAQHLQNTPGTPAIYFPLGAAGSQSALYVVMAYVVMAYIVMAYVGALRQGACGARTRDGSPLAQGGSNRRTPMP